MHYALRRKRLWTDLSRACYPVRPQGRRRVALIGAERAVGRTTVAMSLARRAAAQGASCVLVDADFAQPELAPRLGIVAELGWSQVVGGQRNWAK